MRSGTEIQLNFIKRNNSVNYYYEEYKILKVKNFFAKGLIYFISSALSKGLPIFIIPFIVQLVSAADFGRWAVYQVFIVFTGAAISFSLVSKINREFFMKEKVETAKAVSHAIGISLLFGFSIILFIGFLSLFISEVLGIATPWYMLLGLIGIGNAIHQLILNIYRNEGLEIMYGVFEIGKVIVHLFALFLFVYLFDFGWRGLIGAWTFSTVIIGIISFITVFRKKYYTSIFELEEVKALVIFSYPLVWNLLGGSVIGLSDRIFIKHYLGESQVAYFVIGYTLSMGLVLFSESFNKVWTPWFYKRIYVADLPQKETIVKYTYGFVLILSLCALVSYFLAKFVILYLLPVEYLASLDILAFIASALYLNAVGTLFLPYFIASGKTKVVGRVVILVAILNVILNASLVPLYGIKGAAIATLISFAVKVIVLLTYYQFKSVHPMPWKIKSLKLN